MALTRCPNCDAQVLPGDIQCRRCKYDFILGKQLSADPEADERRRRLIIRICVGAGLAVLVVIVLVWSLRDPEVGPVVDDHPCLEVLARAQPVVASALRRGNPLPTCGATPPGPIECWATTDITTAHLPTVPTLNLSIAPARGGFELQCRADLDGDGATALYEANTSIAGVRISPYGVR
jgi:hypothetical protein